MNIDDYIVKCGNIKKLQKPLLYSLKKATIIDLQNKNICLYLVINKLYIPILLVEECFLIKDNEPIYLYDLYEDGITEKPTHSVYINKNTIIKYCLLNMVYIMINN